MSLNKPQVEGKVPREGKRRKGVGPSGVGVGEKRGKRQKGQSRIIAVVGVGKDSNED
jgi:hypothetical protein